MGAGLCAMAMMLAGCAAPAGPTGQPPSPEQAGYFADPHATPAATVEVLNRITWGANAQSLATVSRIGLQRYLERQLHPQPAVLPAPVQAQIDAMTITQVPFEPLVQQLEQRRKTAAALVDDDAGNAARKEYQQEMTRLAREAATRSLLRALYSPNQLQEQMTWFWMNHFNIFQGKSDLRVMVGNYEEQAIRPHALGKFHEILAAVAHHPAMLRYLDNQQNAAGHVNENYARELMELHTLGVDGGYSQHDVQELARILTGVGVNLGDRQPRLRPELQAQYVRRGLFEFNPNRHDYGDKQFLGQTVRGQGLAELDQALDRLSRAPATARYISRKLAVFLVSDAPPPALVMRMSDTFLHTDGDIAAVLRTLFESPEFQQSLGRQFKDPMHYLLSSVRLACDQQPILNPMPLLNWLNRMGEPLYGRISPDGYAISGSTWSGSGQMTTRFEFARALGSGNTALFRREGTQPSVPPAPPQLAGTAYFAAIRRTLSTGTQQALQQAASVPEWNTFLLASPEMMRR